VVIASFFVIAKVNAMYDASTSKVEKITDANFQSKIGNSDELWLLEFYSNGCGHCRNLEPHWDKAAKILKGVVKLGAVDVDANQ
jgi:protein disulfide-isomerase A6